MWGVARISMNDAIAASCSPSPSPPPACGLFHRGHSVACLPSSERASPRDRAGDDSIPLFLSDPMSNVCIGNCRRRDISSSSVRSFLPLCGRVIASWMEPGFLALASHATFVQSVGQGICCLSTLPLAAVVVEAASAAAYRWKLSNSLRAHRRSRKAIGRPRARQRLGWTDRCNEEGRGDRRVGRRRRRTDGQVAHRLLALPLSLSPSLPLSLPRRGTAGKEFQSSKQGHITKPFFAAAAAAAPVL